MPAYKSGKMLQIGLAAAVLTVVTSSPGATASAQAGAATTANLKASAEKKRPRPSGACDIYAASATPCVAAHSTTRALYASYTGPLYQVLRQSDGRTRDIGVVAPSASDAGGYANAAAQDAFCANTICWISVVYDQSGQGNDLVQAPRGNWSGPAMGGFNNLPIADMAPATVMGHKVYGIFIERGMGFRQNNPKGTAVDDQAEGQYWVVDGHHYDGGCCFNYGNAEIDSRDDGNGTMEAAHFGNATIWYHGAGPGPWIMTDQENNLVGCVNPGDSKVCPGLPSIEWRFVTATADGEAHHWRTMGGNAQTGELKVMFDGPRIDKTYDPMRKQGGIVLGTSGDGGGDSQGTFYEGAMTAPGTFPSVETNQRLQANIVAAGYRRTAVSVMPATATTAPPGLQTFAPGSSQNTTVSFTNPTDAPVAGVTLSLSAPEAWTATVAGSEDRTRMFAGSVAPGATISATFRVSSGPAAVNADLIGIATWTNPSNGTTLTAIGVEKVRNVAPVKINEFAVSSDFPENPTNAFIELYNAGDAAVDLSGWTLTEHPMRQAIFSSIKIPAGTTLAPKGFYLLGLSNSGLALPAQEGDTTIHVRSTTGMSVGDTIEIDIGSRAETRKIAGLGSAAGTGTTVWQPLPDGPVITIPAGSANMPYAAFKGSFAVGETIGLGYGAAYPVVAGTVEKYELVTVTGVGRPGTQAYLAAGAEPGDTNIKVTSVADISVGDRIRLDIDSLGHGTETVTVAKVGSPSASLPGNGLVAQLGTGLELSAALKLAHAANLPFSVRGTGITFAPVTTQPHSSNEPIIAAGTGIMLDRPLDRGHTIEASVRDDAVRNAGYHGKTAPNQWFGGPALFPEGAAMVLRDARGKVVDSLNFGKLVDPWASEGYQAASGATEAGCRAPAPSSSPAAPSFEQPPEMSYRSAGRFPDGSDTDSNCHDFLLQAATTLPVGSAPGSTNFKVASAAYFVPGQSIAIDDGAVREIAIVASVGSSGATTTRTAIVPGMTVIPVHTALGFAIDQTVTIGSGDEIETGTIVSVVGARTERGASITIASPLTRAYEADSLIAGSGITLTSPLTLAHGSGARVSGGLPTPGQPNNYSVRKVQP